MFRAAEEHRVEHDTVRRVHVMLICRQILLPK
jgi:hypothetical protein